MFNHLIAIIAVICVGTGVYMYTHAISVDRFYEQYHRELPSLLPALRERSAAVPTYESLQLALDQSEYGEALKEMEWLITLDSSNVSLRYYAGVLSELEREFDKAEAYYHQVRLDSDFLDRDALKQLVLLYIRKRQGDQAATMLTELQQMGSDEERLWCLKVIKTAPPGIHF